MTEEKKFWFPAKTYGWGWGPPICWQGWVVLIVYIILLIAGMIFFFRRKKQEPEYTEEQYPIEVEGVEVVEEQYYQQYR